ncbi:hypothetical protein ACF0H5_006027 [Mactra antiquata]
MEFCGQASGWSKFSLLFLLAAIAIQCTAIGTPCWMKSCKINNSVNITIGLWRMVNCSGSLTLPCRGMSLTSNYETNLMHTTRQLELTVLLFIVLAAILSFFYVTSPGARTQRVAAWVMLLSFFSMGFAIAGIVVWILNLPDDHYMYWSAGMAAMAGAMCMVSGILIIQDIRMFDYNGIRRKHDLKKAKKLAKKQRKDMLL